MQQRSPFACGGMSLILGNYRAWIETKIQPNIRKQEKESVYGA